MGDSMYRKVEKIEDYDDMEIIGSDSGLVEVIVYYKNGREIGMDIVRLDEHGNIVSIETVERVY